MHARLISTTQIDTNVPRRAMWHGQEIVGDLSQTPGLLESLHYYPVQTSEEPTPQEGYHNEPRYAYDNDETPTSIVQSWEVVQDPPPPPRTFSKLRLVAALMDAGYWTQVKAFIEAQGLMDLYLAAQTFREDDPHFAPALEELKSQLAVPDEEVEKILSAAQTD